MTAERKVLDLLADGRWCVLDTIAASTGMTRREVESVVEDLRLAYHPIIGGPRGVRLTDDPEALAAYLEVRRHRTARIHRGTMRLRTTLARLRQATDLVLWRDVA